MRHVIWGLAAIGLLIAPVAGAEQCSSPADQSTFEVQALKSKLMVHAMSCHTDAQYNTFVNRFRGDLAANEKAFSEYFKRHYGKSSQREQDAYVTQLANAQSDVGMRLGSDFCPRDKTLYDEVMSLENPAELPEYVAGKDLVPASLGACAPVAAPTTKAAAQTRARPVTRAVARH